MKMLCINGDGWETKGFLFRIFKKYKDTTGPSYGDIVHVVGESYEDGMLYYLLKEWPEDDDGFLSDCFIPCSQIDERELAEQRYADAVSDTTIFSKEQMSVQKP